MSWKKEALNDNMGSSFTQSPPSAQNWILLLLYQTSSILGLHAVFEVSHLYETPL
ncbi:MAG: hypothetical protein HND50_17170 [Calditrichaeota bacterium]|nr:hypothetical protein [Calditrichota bacterium]